MAGFAFADGRLGGQLLGHVAPDRRREDAVVRLPPAERDGEKRKLAGLAAPGDLYGRRLAVGGSAHKANVERLAAFEQHVDRLPQQFSRAIAERLLSRAVDPVDRPVRTRGDDGVPCGIDDRMVAGILPVAQNALPRDRNRHVADLQQAADRLARRNRPNDDVVEQFASIVAAQRKQPVQCVRQDAGAADLQCIVDGRRQTRLLQSWKYRKQRFAERSLL